MPHKIDPLRALVASLLLTGCGDANEANVVNGAGNNAAASGNVATDSFVWPATLVPIGDGYPAAGDPCRRLGESAAVADYLDDSADLVGCPGPTDGPGAQAMVQRGGQVVADLSGVSVISVPRGDSGASENQRNAMDGDALVSGTSYNATGSVRCVTAAGGTPSNCEAGVVRNRDGTAIVTVTWPDGRTRGLFFGADGEVTGADTNQADGSAHFQVRGRRDNDTIVVTIGPERYEIPDVFIQGD